MARKTKPENETIDENTQRRLKEEIANNANRSEKTSWNRKMDNMVKLLAELRPIEDAIIDLNEKKIPIFDEIQALRDIMKTDCIHPFEYLLILTDNSVKCKFCERLISAQHIVNENSSFYERM